MDAPQAQGDPAAGATSHRPNFGKGGLEQLVSNPLVIATQACEHRGLLGFSGREQGLFHPCLATLASPLCEQGVDSNSAGFQ